MTCPLSADFCTRFKVHKPPLPYSLGQEIWIRSHSPPAPTQGSRGLTPTTEKERQEIHPLKRCFLHPPHSGAIGNTAMLLKLLKEVRVGDGHRAQLFTVKVVQVMPEGFVALPSTITMVAKFYDPLYFDHKQDDSDPFICTDQDYAHEAKAYHVLESLQGTAIPKYHGSYTCELPTPDGNRRSVRLILMEYIPGSFLQQLKPTSFSQAARQNILKQIVDAESAFYTHDVTHGDSYPRNVILSINTLNPHSFRVVLIDFGKSRFNRHRPGASLEERQKYLSKVPITPLLRWHNAHWNGPPNQFAEWIDWDWQPWLERNWSVGGAITSQMREVWLPDFLLNPPDFDDEFF